ncbi:hemerythrin [Mycobacterium kansasii]|uniref:Iron-sulfur cluster repair protein YtfE n=1 Tax=Mycobacterium innocens TaxID=2341083 RepID=A0A498PPP6_9MYCO|nr:MULTISPECIES: hemerythrin domain-containing protein [Mycobacterium]KZS77682.1 hemerythrin [Mycobacterium kansasii]VBA33782.1 Iron-sulfur cluster repair protein YtfE [Mycobacterium innocens]
MPDPADATALKREHHEIDCAIEVFVEAVELGYAQPEALTAALDTLRRHIYVEEVFLFPPIRQAGMVMPILVMLREHGELWHTMDTLKDLLADGEDLRRLAKTCRQLLAQLDRHNSKEEPVVYPHADVDLPPQTTTELARFIESGRAPDGWVCQHASG